MDGKLWADAVAKDLTPHNIVDVCSLLFSQGNGGEAVRIAMTAAANTERPDLIFASATVMANSASRHDIAATMYRKALHFLPTSTPELKKMAKMLKTCLADSLMADGKVAESIEIYKENLADNPSDSDGAAICEHISMSLLEAGYPREALEVLQSWLQNGSASAILLNNLGCALQRLNRSDEALPHYEKAVALSSQHPDIQFGYAITLLKAGKIEEGLRRYARRPPSMTNDNYWFLRLPRLTNTNTLSGKTIIFYQEQGLGDTLQFVRYIPWVVSQGAKVILAVPPQLFRLIKASYPDVDVRLITEFDGPQPDKKDMMVDFGCPIPDLPFIAHIKGISASELVLGKETEVPYLSVPQELTDRFADLCDRAVETEGQAPDKRRLRIGIVWSGDRRKNAKDVAADKRRSVTFDKLIHALTPIDADLFNLQFGPRREDIAGWEGQQIIDLMGEVGDMLDTAALIKNLDMVVSVDTSVVHLAGALGVPVWMISRWDACWRWGDQGETSPWYPTLKIFRSTGPTFDEVLSQVGDVIKDAVALADPDVLLAAATHIIDANEALEERAARHQEQKKLGARLTTHRIHL